MEELEQRIAELEQQTEMLKGLVKLLLISANPSLDAFSEPLDLATNLTER
jgi:hypothetical protein